MTKDSFAELELFSERQIKLINEVVSEDVGTWVELVATETPSTNN